jgi:hypothetical protein
LEPSLRSWPQTTATMTTTSQIQLNEST